MTIGQPDSVTLPERDECIMAAQCNLIKGDVTIESQGHPGEFYKYAIQNLQKSQKYKKCPTESIFLHCKKKRLECESDINILARNTFGISLELLAACPYLTWPFMIFNCQNYENWPQPANLMIPERSRSCLTQCYLVDEFETIQRTLNLTDFPQNWEAIKNISKHIKSTMRTIEERQGSSILYPWDGRAPRTRMDITEKFFYLHGILGGIRGPEIFCPPNHYIDAVQQEFISAPSRGVPTVTPNLSFRCSEFTRLNETRELWTHALNATHKTTSCYRPAEKRFIAAVNVIFFARLNFQSVSYDFSCERLFTPRSNIYNCPPLTALCSVALYYSGPRAGPVTRVTGFNFGCCAYPRIVKECGTPIFTLEKIDVNCVKQSNPEIQSCSYISQFGLEVNGVLNTTVQTDAILLEHAGIFEKILTGIIYVHPMFVRHSFDWTNVPEKMRQLAVKESHTEILESSSRFFRRQPKITCGKYVIHSRDQLKNFVPSSESRVVEEYLEFAMEGCTPGFQTLPKTFKCLSAPKSACQTLTLECRLCNATFEYGLDLPRGVNLSKVEASKLYERLLRIHTLSGLSDGMYDWVNVPNNPSSTTNLETLTVVNRQSEFVTNLGLPVLKCGSGTIVAKNLVELVIFVNGRYRRRLFKNGFQLRQ